MGKVHTLISKYIVTLLVLVLVTTSTLTSASTSQFIFTSQSQSQPSSTSTSNYQQQLFKLVLLSQSNGASCLDGSPPGIYVSQGMGDAKQNYLIYFSGGGFCGQSTLSATLQSCYQRSFSGLGSTKNASSTKNTTGNGILSNSVKQNQYFYDWTKIGVIYCDGHQYAGHRQNPIQYKDRKLYFRGSRNVKQVFRYLQQKYNFYSGNKIVITGGSAGGISTFQWSNYLYQHTKSAKIYALPDSGFFITDYYSPIVSKKLLREDAGPLLNLVYNQTQMPQPINKCINISGYDIVDCFNVANYAQYLKSPIFMIQSPYDQWSINYILGTRCLANKQSPFSLKQCNTTTRQVIEDYRIKSLAYLENIKSGRKDRGIWGPACVQHCFNNYQKSYDNKNFTVGGYTLMRAIQKFIESYDKGENVPWLLDEIEWPNNVGCNGIVAGNLKYEEKAIWEE